MHTTGARHRNKRHLNNNQPAITNYFATAEHFGSAAATANDDDDDTTARPSQPATHALLAPQVPGPVQSDLLQVGMRVRKSVPEGYKTHASKMMALPSIQTTMTSRTTTMTLTPSPPSVPDNIMHQRELLPFCGLHKIGGYAEQPTTNIHLYTGAGQGSGVQGTQGDVWPLAAETFRQPFHTLSSQDSGYETARPNSNPSKRSWHDEDDIRLDISRTTFVFGKQAHLDLDDVPVSPLSDIPQDMLPAVRQIKMPKSRRRDAVMDMGGVAPGRSAADFEEADFLATEEVIMGGV